MNKKYYGDSRYVKVWEQMQLLQIEDVTTKRQDKNGTIVWKLPIKNYNSGKTNIEVASMKTGYVRNQNSGYSNYQLNKRCESDPQYYPETKYNVDTNESVKTGKYLKFTTRGCKLIPLEIDRLEYLIAYCLKNYYIKHANFVADGEYVHKWTHEWDLKQAKDKYNNLADAARLDYERHDLESRLELRGERSRELEDKVYDLENKLDRIKTFLKHEL
jgi:hypothetical protein